MRVGPVFLTVLATGATALLVLALPPDPALDGSPNAETLSDADNFGPIEADLPLPPLQVGGPYDRFAKPRGPLTRILDVSFIDLSGERYDGMVFSKRGDLVPVNSVYRNCRATEKGFSCDTEDEFDHPYAAYSFDELISIADFDAAASFILGDRIFEDPAYRKQFAGDTWYQEGVNRLLNASLLSGTRQPYTAMMIHRKLFALGDVEGAAGWNRLEQIYAWSRAGIELGYLDPAWPGYHATRRFVSEEWGDEARSIFEDLDKKADAIKRYLIEKKARTTG
jgi:hypothetical protein